MVPVGISVMLLIMRASLMYDVHCLASLGYGSLPLYVNWVVPLQLEAGVGFWFLFINMFGMCVDLLQVHDNILDIYD